MSIHTYVFGYMYINIVVDVYICKYRSKTHTFRSLLVSKPFFSPSTSCHLVGGNLCSCFKNYIWRFEILKHFHFWCKQVLYKATTFHLTYATQQPWPCGHLCLPDFVHVNNSSDIATVSMSRWLLLHSFKHVGLW